MHGRVDGFGRVPVETEENTEYECVCVCGGRGKGVDNVYIVKRSIYMKCKDL